MGKGLELLRRFSEVEAILVDIDLKVHVTAGLKECFQPSEGINVNILNEKEGDIRMKRKGKIRMLIIILGIVVVIGLGLGGALIFTSGERREGRSLPITDVDFKKLNDGTYIGEYEGGMNKWRTNEVEVTVSSGKVTDIKLLKHKENRPPEFTDKLYNRVIKSQSLQVDTISGATITSKAYLKSVENALLKAQKN